MTKTHKDKITVLNGKLRLRQPENGFRTSLDSVMLAAACPVENTHSILDLGCGVGSAGLSVLYRVSGTHLTGIDIQADHVSLATENAKINALDNQTNFVTCDILEYTGARHDHVIFNPPYMEAGTYLISPHEAKAKAHGHDETTELKDWIDCGFRNLKSGGSMTLIHRADQTGKIIQAMGKRFGAIEIIPLWPKQGIEAKRVIIRARKDRKSPSRLHPGLILHNQSGYYTKDAEKILRDGHAIL